MLYLNYKQHKQGEKTMLSKSDAKLLKKEKFVVTTNNDLITAVHTAPASTGLPPYVIKERKENNKSVYDSYFAFHTETNDNSIITYDTIKQCIPEVNEYDD